jgi:general secretion pathway protein G
MNRINTYKTLLRRQQQAGVSLVEVLIVVAIMAMLAGGVAFAILPRMAEARLKTAKQGAQEIRKAVQLWQVENGGECPTMSTLKKDGVLDKAGTSDDPWGKPFTVKCADGEVYVGSNGPDTKKGSEDDIEIPGPSKDDEEP